MYIVPTGAQLSPIPSGGTQRSLVIAWSELPAYGARCIREVRAAGYCCCVISSPGALSEREIRELCGCPAILIDSRKKTSWGALGMPIPDVFVQAGWEHAGFNSLGAEVRRNSGIVVGMVDNSYRNSVRQRIGALVFRLLYRNRFSAVLVPGKTGVRLLTHLGMPRNRIFTGLYGADPAIFSCKTPLEARTNELLYVGQLIERKGISTLINAFERCVPVAPDLKLRIIGAGPLESLVTSYASARSNVSFEHFSPSERISERMNAARMFVLPSKRDHWGVVLHEAGCCGCILIASKAVGAQEDLIEPGINGSAFRPEDPADLANAVLTWQKADAARLAVASKRSVELARSFGPGAFAHAVVNEVMKLRR